MYAIPHVLSAIFSPFVALFNDKYGKRPHVLILNSLIWMMAMINLLLSINITTEECIL